MSEPAFGMRVVGEDLPRGVAIGLLLLGGLLSMAALHSWTQDAPPARPTMTASEPRTASPSPSEPGPRAAAIDAGSSPSPVDPRAAAAGGPAAADAAASGAKPPPTQRSAMAGDDTTEDCAPVFAVRFRFGSNLSRATTVGSMARLSAWLQAHPAARLSIDGYSDQLGPVSDRFAISQRRAQAVADELVRAGAPRAQLQVRALGHYVPGGSALPSRDSRLVLLHVDGHAACQEEGRDIP